MLSYGPGTKRVCICGMDTLFICSRLILPKKGCPAQLDTWHSSYWNGYRVIEQKMKCM